MRPDEREKLQKEPGAEKLMQKHQAIFHLDFETWENIIDAFDITESVHSASDTRSGCHGECEWVVWVTD